MNISGLLGSPDGKNLGYRDVNWDLVGDYLAPAMDGQEPMQYMPGVMQSLTKLGMTPEQAKAQGYRYVTGDYGKDKFLVALVDGQGNVVDQRVTDKTDRAGMFKQFALASLALGAGIGALGLPLTPGAAAASGAASGGVTTGAAGGAATGGGGLLGEFGLTPLTGAAAEGAGTALTGSTVGGMGTGLGGIEGGLLASGGLGSGLGLSPSAGLGALTNVGGAVTGAPSVPKVPTSAPGGLLNNDMIKAGVIGAGAIAGSQKEDGEKLTSQNKLDPRMDQFLYGTGGLLPEAMAWYNQNKSGVNPTMQKGWDMQLGILTDPRVQQTLGGMMNRFSQPVPVAGNPFMRGK